MFPLSDALGSPAGGSEFDAMRFGRIPPGAGDTLGGAAPTVAPPNGLTFPPPADPMFLQVLMTLLKKLTAGSGPSLGPNTAASPAGPSNMWLKRPGERSFQDRGTPER